MTKELAERIQQVEKDTVEHIGQCKVRNKQQEDTNKDHERRIRALEKVQWKQAGIVGFLCFIASAVAAPLVTKWFGP